MPNQYIVNNFHTEIQRIRSQSEVTVNNSLVNKKLSCCSCRAPCRWQFSCHSVTQRHSNLYCCAGGE